MNCTVCEESGGKLVLVEYEDGNDERVRLCKTCQAEFEDGGLVQEVAPTDSA